MNDADDMYINVDDNCLPFFIYFYVYIYDCRILDVSSRDTATRLSKYYFNFYKLHPIA